MAEGKRARPCTSAFQTFSHITPLTSHWPSKYMGKLSAKGQEVKVEFEYPAGSPLDGLLREVHVSMQDVQMPPPPWSLLQGVTEGRSPRPHSTVPHPRCMWSQAAESQAEEAGPRCPPSR